MNLAENLIVELVPRVFYMLGKLKFLCLSGNPLIDLPPDVFKDILVGGTKHVQLRLMKIWAFCAFLSNILLVVRASNLTDLIIHFVEQELKELQCRNCNIKKINPQVYNLLQRLEYLDLGDNQVITLFHSQLCAMGFLWLAMIQLVLTFGFFSLIFEYAS